LSCLNKAADENINIGSEIKNIKEVIQGVVVVSEPLVYEVGRMIQLLFLKLIMLIPYFSWRSAAVVISVFLVCIVFSKQNTDYRYIFYISK
jgi:hypothetical protein